MQGVKRELTDTNSNLTCSASGVGLVDIFKRRLKLEWVRFPKIQTHERFRQPYYLFSLAILRGFDRSGCKRPILRDSSEKCQHLSFFLFVWLLIAFGGLVYINPGYQHIISSSSMQPHSGSSTYEYLLHL